MLMLMDDDDAELLMLMLMLDPLIVHTSTKLSPSSSHIMIYY